MAVCFILGDASGKKKKERMRERENEREYDCLYMAVVRNDKKLMWKENMYSRISNTPFQPLTPLFNFSSLPLPTPSLSSLSLPHNTPPSSSFFPHICRCSSEITSPPSLSPSSSSESSSSSSPGSVPFFPVKSCNASYGIASNFDLYSSNPYSSLLRWHSLL